jgi:hypothetical protein
MCVEEAMGGGLSMPMAQHRRGSIGAPLTASHSTLLLSFKSMCFRIDFWVVCNFASFESLRLSVRV